MLFIWHKILNFVLEILLDVPFKKFLRVCVHVRRCFFNDISEGHSLIVYTFLKSLFNSGILFKRLTLWIQEFLLAKF